MRACTGTLEFTLWVKSVLQKHTPGEMTTFILLMGKHHVRVYKNVG